MWLAIVIILNANLEEFLIAYFYFRPTLGGQQSSDHKPSETFLKFAFMNILFDIVVVSKDANILIEGMTLLCADGVPMTGDQISFCKEKIYDEVISLMTSGKFTLEQVIMSALDHQVAIQPAHDFNYGRFESGAYLLSRHLQCLGK